MKERFIKRINGTVFDLHNFNLFCIGIDKKIMFDYGNIYVDIDKLRKTSYDGGWFIHFGIRPEKSFFKSRTKEEYKINRSDFYIPANEKTLKAFYQIVKKLEEFLNDRK